MCGRYGRWSRVDEIAVHFGITTESIISPRYNIAPGHIAPIVRIDPESNLRDLIPAQWGLLPFWSKDKKIASKLINARSETAFEKPAFRAAFKYRRALIPANGFYEWKKAGKEKFPHWIHLKGQELFAMAGLWESWESPAGELIDSFTILTTEPNSLVAEIHNRMPVILGPAHYASWLDPQNNGKPLSDLLGPFPTDEMTAYPVSKLVNDVHNDVPECIDKMTGSDTENGRRQLDLFS